MHTKKIGHRIRWEEKWEGGGGEILWYSHLTVNYTVRCELRSIMQSHDHHINISNPVM